MKRNRKFLQCLLILSFIWMNGTFAYASQDPFEEQAEQKYKMTTQKPRKNQPIATNRDGILELISLPLPKLSSENAFKACLTNTTSKVCSAMRLFIRHGNKGEEKISDDQINLFLQGTLTVDYIELIYKGNTKAPTDYHICFRTPLTDESEFINFNISPEIFEEIAHYEKGETLRYLYWLDAHKVRCYYSFCKQLEASLTAARAIKLKKFLQEHLKVTDINDPMIERTEEALEANKIEDTTILNFKK